MSTSRTLPFAVARAIVRKLKLKSDREWHAWSKAGQRPSNIPSSPYRTYRDDGWISMPDWLGYTGVTQRKDMLTFAAARVIVWKLKLKGQKEWKEWSKSGQRPTNIPATPSRTYRDDGWISYPDWLGYEGRALPGSMLPFAVARAIVQKLKLESREKWREWRKSGQRPSNIPSDPSEVYRDDGWISYPDWLGYGSAGGGGSQSSSSSGARAAPGKKKKEKKRKRSQAQSVQRESSAAAKLVGRFVRKNFVGHGTFDGEVVRCTPYTDKVLFGVEYPDGDREDMDLEEVEQHLVPVGEETQLGGRRSGGVGVAADPTAAAAITAANAFLSSLSSSSSSSSSRSSSSSSSSSSCSSTTTVDPAAAAAVAAANAFLKRSCDPP